MGVKGLKTWVEANKSQLEQRVNPKEHLKKQGKKKIVLLADATHVVVPPTLSTLGYVLEDYVELRKHIERLCNLLLEELKCDLELYVYFDTDPLDSFKLQ